MDSEFIGGVVFALWTAAALVAAFVGGWWAHKSMWWEDHERINAFWQEDRNRVDELLRLCESHQEALQAAHGLRPDSDQLPSNPRQLDSQPAGTWNGMTLQQMIDNMVARAVKDKGLAKAQAIIDALPPEQQDLVWRNGMATNNEPRTPVVQDAVE